MVDETPDDAGTPPAADLIRPYVVAVGDLPPRPPWPDGHAVGSPADRAPRDDDTVIIEGDAAHDGRRGERPAHRRPRGRRAVVIAAAGVAVALALGTYPLWRPDARSGVFQGIAASATPQPGTSSPEPVTTRSTVSASPTPPRPAATHRVTPSPSRSTASPTASPSTSPRPAAPAISSTPPAPPVPGAIVGLAAKCADNNGQVTANGNRIQLFECNGTVAQVWTVEPDGTLRVQGKCLRAGNPTPGSRTDLWDCDGGAGETWRSAGGGAVVNVASGLCLDVRGSSTADGTPLDIAPCTGADNQRWHLP